MGKKVKITERQFNMIVESVFKEGYINEEQLDEGLKEWLMISAMLFPSLSKAGAINATKALNQSPIGKEMIMKAKEDVNKGDTYKMTQDKSEMEFNQIPTNNLEIYNLGKKIINKLSKEKLKNWVEIKHPKTGYPIEIELLLISKPDDLGDNDFKVIKEFIKWVKDNYNEDYKKIYEL